MKKTKKPSEITVELIGLAQNLQDIASHVSMLEEKLNEKIIKLPVEYHQNGNAFGMTNLSHEFRRHETATLAGKPSNIILFPGSGAFNGSKAKPKSSLSKPSIDLKPLLGTPGKSLPPDIPDCRPLLQRDGLILLAWDKRVTESGELYTAYWITSIDVPRFYASKSYLLKDFHSASPDRKSYAAEDGIEYYGQSAPEYLVHVAPELMKSNPNHKDLRAEHIKTLNHMGSKVNFNYKYLLQTEKKKGTFKKQPSAV